MWQLKPTSNQSSGVWVLRVPRGRRAFNESFFELKQDGESITGTHR
jgi:hypothetical protein